MDERAIRVLEYNKIIEMLASECCSSLTRAEALQLLPDTDPIRIREALYDTDEAVTVLMKKGTPPLGNFYDISGYAHLAAKEGVLTPKELLEVAYNLNYARRTESYLSSDLPELPRIDALVSAISVLSGLEDEITRCIISEDEISDSASPELRRIRKAILRQNESIRTKIQQIVGSADNRAILQDAIVTMRQGRYVIPVKLEHRNRLPGIVHDQSASGATLFVEPQAIVTMNNELRELELAEKQEIHRILKELSAQVGACELQIKGNQEIMVKLDFMFAKGRLACNMNACRPVLDAEGVVELKKARHPLIDPRKVVPINIGIGDGYNTLVITGPNTGGKTVTLKTVGLLCLMAQSGLFIPASDGSRVPVFSDIFADIGDEQSIEQSLSTFSSHMTNIVHICRFAGRGSLVLTDELGAGTDPTEGAALAISILNHLNNKGAKTIATTHYTELKKYALTTKGVQNASMEFDVKTLSPTFRLMIGLPGKSNAFEISEKLGLPLKVIDHARRFIEEGDAAFEDVISTIEEGRKKTEEDLRRAEQLRAEMEAQKARMDEAEAKLKAKREEYLEEAREEARSLVDDARRSITELQKDLADALDSREVNRIAEEGKKALSEKRKSYAGKTRDPVNYDKPRAEDIRPGIRVNVLSVGQKGTVLDVPDDKGDMQVQVGALKLRVNLSGVTIVKENVTEKEREKIKYSRIAGAKALTVPMSINVIGQNLADARLAVEKYLDDAFLANLETVTIIHGRGAGILRDGIASMLKKDKRVASFRRGSIGEGGDGVTVVTLKR
ncbi:MAG: endonuclease MutS2 [Firmicutes bacterium]|nr:endonuclease MutS2 [Bacillota bacterium]